MERMIGATSRLCPYGKHCTCNDSPGKERTRHKRELKAREKRDWRKEWGVR